MTTREQAQRLTANNPELATVPCHFCSRPVVIVFATDGDKDWACGRCAKAPCAMTVRQR